MKRIFQIIAIVLLVVACSENKEKEPVLCTEEYVTLTVKVKDTKGNPIALDKIEVVRQDTEKNITKRVVGEWELHQKFGAYPFYSDYFTHQDKGKNITINFKGYIGDSEVINTNILVSADDCHVFYISGKKEFVLE